MPKTNNRNLALVQSVAAYRTAAIAVLVVLVGLGLLYLSSGAGWFARHSTTKAVADQLGGTLIVTGGLGLLWDLRGRRDMVAEVMAKIELSDDIESSGLQRAHMDWRVVPWGELITSSNKIDVFIAYGSTWLSTYSVEFAEFAKNRKNKMRFVLPDPSDRTTLESLAQRFDYPIESIQGRILDAARVVATLARNGSADIRVRYRKGDPTFTCYRFDDTVVVTLYSHGGAKGAVPTFQVHRGSMADFFTAELDAVNRQGREVGHNELLGESNVIGP